MQKKKCTKCDEEKEITNFHKSKTGKYNVESRCKLCQKEYKRQYNKNNYPLIKEKKRQNYIENKEEILLYGKQWRDDNKKLTKKYRLKNKEKKKEYDKMYYAENKNLLYEQNKNNHRNRYQNDHLFRLKSNISRSIYGSIKTNKHGKLTKNILSYTIEELKTHLESQFVKGMSWDNHGSEWHLDHIRPIDSFNITSIEDEDFQKCWALPNLQPLWANLNLEKSNQWDGTETNKTIQLEYQNNNR